MSEEEKKKLAKEALEKGFKYAEIGADEASRIANEMLDRFVMNAPDIEGVDSEDQKIFKITVLVTACQELLSTVREINRMLDPKRTEAYKKKEKGWN